MNILLNSKLSKLIFVVFFIVYFLYLVIAKTPAQWAAWAIHEAVPSSALTSVSGTLWKGRARSMQVDMGPSTIPFGELSWRLEPLSLLTLSPCIEFKTNLPGQNVEGEYCASVGGSSRIRNLNIDAPVDVIQGLIQVRSGGNISLQIIEASFDASGKVEKFDGRFSWQKARLFEADTWFNLGSFGAKVSENGSGGIKADIFDLEGPYKVELKANWTANSPWSFEGTVAPQAAAPDMAVQALSIVGEERSEGVYYVRWP